MILLIKPAKHSQYYKKKTKIDIYINNMLWLDLIRCV